MMRRHVMTRAGAAVLLIAGLAACTAHRDSAAADAAPPVPVTTALVTMTDAVVPIEAGGVVQARTTATLTARILAPIREIRVSPGDHVRAGQVLVVLDSNDLAAAAHAAKAAALAAEQGAKAAAAERQSAEAALVLAKATHDRVAGLQAKRSATAQELDDATAVLRGAESRVAGAAARTQQADAALESARAASDQAGTTESFASVTAPFDGMVTEKMVEPGNMASPGTPLLRIEDTRGFQLEVRVDESRIGLIRNGDKVPVAIDSLSASAQAPFTGTVSEVSRAVDADSRAFLVKIALPDAAGLRSGLFGKAQFAGPARRVLTIPPSAIVRRGQVTSVFVLDQGMARVRLISVDRNEVLAGLSESEVVVASPPPSLTDGRRVSVGGR